MVENGWLSHTQDIPQRFEIGFVAILECPDFLLYFVNFLHNILIPFHEGDTLFQLGIGHAIESLLLFLTDDIMDLRKGSIKWASPLDSLSPRPPIFPLDTEPNLLKNAIIILNQGGHLIFQFLLNELLKQVRDLVDQLIEVLLAWLAWRFVGWSQLVGELLQEGFAVEQELADWV